MFVLNQTELLAIAESPVWSRAKIQRKHNFRQLPKVNCESQYCEIRVSRTIALIAVLAVECVLAVVISIILWVRFKNKSSKTHSFPLSHKTTSNFSL